MTVVPAVCHWLRSRYDVALVDEFQDTDLVQWDIIRRVFGSGDSTLVLIGDPKQAIYAFRGADVYSYLGAAKEAATKATLVTNWRSDQGLIDAYDALFAGSQLGHEGIAYRTVKAAAPNANPRLIGAPGAPLRIRVVDRNDVGLTPQGYASLNPARALVARDLAADVVTLLTSGAEVVQPGGRHEPVRPGHLAVLVFANNQAVSVCGALHDAGVPAVTSGSGSVFATEPATEWLQLLDALERPTARDRAGAVALTAFIGWNGDRVANATEAEWEDLHWLLHRWAALLRRRGIAALLEHMSATQHLPQRILSRTSGERFLTDLRHVGQLLHAEAKAENLGSTALTTWLRRRIDDAGGRPKRRRPQPSPRVRRRGRAGAHHSPQQGPRVPDRVLPVSVGCLQPHRRHSHVPRPAPRRRPHHRRRWRRRTRTSSHHCDPGPRRGAR